MASERLFVIADVGGTNTRAALARGGAVQTETITRIRNTGHTDLQSLIAGYLRDQGGPAVDGACVALAGPVLDGVGRLTNLDWTLDRDVLAACTGAGTVAILNDLQAQGHALDHIAADCLIPLVAGPEAGPHKAKMVIGCGTGFNAVPVFRTETGRYVPPCESGHATFPVLSEDDMSLAQEVASHHGFPGVEDVLSGRGFERIYVWAGGAAKSSTDIMAELEAGDPTAVRTARTFVQALGRVAGDLALTHLPFGGIYLIGGMTQAMTPYLSRFGFEAAMRGKGRFSTFMESFAVWGVEDDYAALTGCAHHLQGLSAAS